MKKVERISPEERSPPDLSNLLHHHTRYCLNDPSIRGGGGETRDTVNRWKRLGKQWKLEKLALFFFFIFIFSNGSASLKAQTMLISQRVSSIYKSIPGGCLAGPPFLCVCVCIHCVYFSFYPLFHSSRNPSHIRKETFISRNFISSGLSIGRNRENKDYAPDEGSSPPILRGSACPRIDKSYNF